MHADGRSLITIGRINFKRSFGGEERVEGATGRGIIELRDFVEVAYSEELKVEVSGCTASEKTNARSSP